MELERKNFRYFLLALLLTLSAGCREQGSRSSSSSSIKISQQRQLFIDELELEFSPELPKGLFLTEAWRERNKNNGQRICISLRFDHDFLPWDYSLSIAGANSTNSYSDCCVGDTSAIYGVNLNESVLQDSDKLIFSSSPRFDTGKNYHKKSYDVKFWGEARTNREADKRQNKGTGDR